MRSTSTQTVCFTTVIYSALCDSNPVLLQTESSSASSGTCFHPLANFVSCERFSENHQKYMAAVNLLDEPAMNNQAVKDKVWRNAMTFEVDALEERDTWDMTKLPPGMKAIGSKWVFRIKYNSDGSLE